MRYRISIKGHLDPSWQEWFEDLQILPEASNKTVLCGSLLDQAALYRVLLKINSLGLILLSLETYETPEAQERRRQDTNHPAAPSSKQGEPIEPSQCRSQADDRPELVR
ncbi:hypothetical protein [Ktedonobacter sp. SOSP1-85]|uniref:hypothetical protein n=1 Tax=Ktedonobacter sp. SOSP1-85 TaxID=2778367 RepID=UPI0027DC7E95|nr:hypothetical protein [Ktedonobacter sp. SOSP1-85]